MNFFQFHYSSKKKIKIKQYLQKERLGSAMSYCPFLTQMNTQKTAGHLQVLSSEWLSSVHIHFIEQPCEEGTCNFKTYNVWLFWFAIITELFVVCIVYGVISHVFNREPL